MRRAMYIAAVVLLAVMVCVLAVAMKAVSSRNAQAAATERERLEQTILDLQRQIRQVKAQEKSAGQKVGQLQDTVFALSMKAPGPHEFKVGARTISVQVDK